MTTPNIPDLPYDLATDGDGRVLQLKEAPETGYYIRATHPRVGGIAVRVDPADLIRNLSRFVPIPAEARKVITAWLARTESSRPLPDHADDLLATLAAAGLLVGPGEPAASEGEPVAWMDTDGDFFVADTRHPAGHNIGHREVFSIEDCALENYTALYAHPPITAEPAVAPSVTDASVGNSDATVSAPSVEQIAEVLKRRYPSSRIGWTKGAAEQIRALWSPAPGDAAALARTSEQYHRAQQYAVKATALEGQRNEARAEVERLRAALEAAEGLIHAQKNLALKSAEVRRWHDARDYAYKRHEEAQDAYDDARDYAYKRHEEAQDAYDAARAAVEADTTEEARDA